MIKWREHQLPPFFVILSNGKILVGNNLLWFGSNKIQLPQDTIPSGIIAMWSGASNVIPAGWVLCNGQNGTPDLRNRFIVGAGSTYSVGATGGSNTVTLATSNIPSHTHSHSFSVNLSGLTCSSAGEHTHTIRTGDGSVSSARPNSAGGASTSRPGSINTESAGSHTHTISGSGSLSGSISNTGGGQAHENRPPYYALCFIMKI